MRDPKYLLQPDGPGGDLFGYWTPELLLLDVTLHGEWDSKVLRIYKLDDCGPGRVVYRLTSLTELKNQISKEPV